MLSARKRGVLAFVSFRGAFSPATALGFVVCAWAPFACAEPSANAVITPSSEASAEAPWVVFEGSGKWLEWNLTARLQPLLGSQERRHFDTQAWNLPEGHILWRLQVELTFSDGKESPSSSSAGLGLAGLMVRHEGPNPLRFGEVSPENGVYEPLQVLLAAPGGTLVPGGQRSMVLTGPEDLTAPTLSSKTMDLRLHPNSERTAQGPVDVPILDFTKPRAQ
ncbi:MAG: hypothetical protein GY930_20435 [bacterium]|nr:hypothetical protein [bacterium]